MVVVIFIPHGSVVEGGSAAPGLQTERPAEDGEPVFVQLVRYVPVSSQVNPEGQQVCWVAQQTAPAYGQQPCALPEYLAAQTVPTAQTWPASAASGGTALDAEAAETRRAVAVSRIIVGGGTAASLVGTRFTAGGARVSQPFGASAASGQYLHRRKMDAP